MNIACLVGRLTKDPDLRTTSTGKSVCNFSIAVDRTFSDDTDFFDVVAWGKTGENTSTYMAKGSQVAVSGRLEQQTWEKDGQKRSKVVVVAENVKFLDRRSDAEPF